MTVLVLPGTVSDSSALVLLYCLCKSHQRSLVSATPVYGESGCKGKDFQAFGPNFRGTFFKVFFGAGLRKSSFPKAGAKVRGIFQTAKHSASFFESFFREPSAWASLGERRESPGRKGKRAERAAASSPQTPKLPFRKRVQNYGFHGGRQKKAGTFFSRGGEKLTQKTGTQEPQEGRISTGRESGGRRRTPQYINTRAHERTLL